MTDRIKEIYQAARGISSMRDDFMEPWEFEYAKLIIRECISVLNEAADDIDNGNIFNNQELLNKFEERWSAGLYYSVDKIKEHFGVEE